MKPLEYEIKVLLRHVNLKPNEEQTLHVPLRHYVETGQRLWLAVESFKTDNQSWSDDGQEIVKAIKQHDALPD
jgi:hypothetical protein